MERELGAEPVLDAALVWVLDLYWQRRRQQASDRGITIEDDDPILSRHLLAMDGVYLSMRDESIRESNEQAQAGVRQIGARR